MVDRLVSLKLSAFRGAPEPFVLNFDRRKNLTVIYGENGSGKTTICDAFVLLADGEVGSLKDRGLGTGLHQYWPSLGKKLQDIEVALETENGRCTASINKTRLLLDPPGSQPRVAMLRRDLMARLTESTPLNRYQAISRFIDVSAFESSEANLVKLQTDLSRQIEISKTAESRSLDLLNSILTRSGEKTDKNPIEWAREKAAAADKDSSAQSRAVGELLNVIERFEPIPKLVSASTDRITTTKNNLAVAEKDLADAASKAGDAAEELLAVLQAGQDYLAARGQVEACPLCESTERAAELPRSVTERLARLKLLQDAVAARGNATDAHKAAMDEARILAEQYQQLCRAYRQVVEGHVWPADMAVPFADTPERASGLPDWLTVNHAKFQSWRELRDRLVSQREFAKTLKEALVQYDESRTRQTSLAELVPAVTKAQDICRAERQAFVDEIIGDIAVEVQRLYTAIHPGEGMGDVTFAFDPAKKASLDLYMGYAGTNVPPQAYFSQSHLDTLGLCITMALAKRERPDETILVLDDVLGSVDEPHVERVIQMIYDESKNFRHTIVTTHYRPWREKRRWGSLAAGHLQFEELSPWHKGDGMRMGKAIPELALLERYLAESPPDCQAICAKAGVILEACLTFLTLQYQCRLPRKRAEDYTIQEMLDAFDPKLRGCLRVQTREKPDDVFLDIELGPILDRLRTVFQVRNLTGAHFRDLSFTLLDGDTLRFAEAVRELAAALCHREGGLPEKDDSGSYWRNVGDTRRLHPLKRPA